MLEKEIPLGGAPELQRGLLVTQEYEIMRTSDKWRKAHMKI